MLGFAETETATVLYICHDGNVARLKYGNLVLLLNVNAKMANLLVQLKVNSDLSGTYV